jgi:hypothetical protein
MLLSGLTRSSLLAASAGLREAAAIHPVDPDVIDRLGAAVMHFYCYRRRISANPGVELPGHVDQGRLVPSSLRSLAAGGFLLLPAWAFSKLTYADCLRNARIAKMAVTMAPAASTPVHPTRSPPRRGHNS